MSEIKFPQPVAPGTKMKNRQPYFLALPRQYAARWDGDENEKSWLEAGLIYLTEAERDQRLAYEAQENAKRIMPQFVRDLGPDVEAKWPDGEWRIFHVDQVKDWRGAKPENYRAKPKQIVRTVDGVEYRWAKNTGARLSKGYFVNSMGAEFYVSGPDDDDSGPRAHQNKADADAMCAALNAVLGVSDA